MAVNPTEVFKTHAPQARVTTPVRRVALVLAGAGHRDGAEITEAVSLMVCLSEAGFEANIFAPDRPLAGTVNHLTGEALPETRSILEESARIARGNVRPLEDCLAKDFDALVFAGGFGAARNLSNFAFVGADARLEADVKRVIGDFVSTRRPVAALCIAPVLIALDAKETGLKGVAITLGDGSAKGAVQAVESWGAKHVPCSVREACVDPVNRIVSAPAYMDAQASSGDVFASAQALVDGLRQLLSRP